MHWSEQYLGIPWLPGGREPEEGLDCWGLLRHYYKREYGIDLSVNANATLDNPDIMLAVFHSESGGGVWREVTDPHDGDAVGIGKGDTLSHVGVYVLADGVPSMLHSHIGSLSSINSLRQMRRTGWPNVKYYRHDLRFRDHQSV